jgi:hypothetical protein
MIHVVACARRESSTGFLRHLVILYLRFWSLLFDRLRDESADEDRGLLNLEVTR